jgi:glycolate oxidase
MHARTKALETLLVRLNSRFGERISTDPDELAKVSGDESGLPKGNPGAVVWPMATAEVALVAQEAQELGVGLVPRGAGTGKAGESIPLGGELVVDLSRMNKILELRPQDLYAVVQPGLITAELDKAAKEHGFMYPPDPASWESCSIGGNINTNAGGPRAVKYGVTQRYVWGLEVVLAGGKVLRTGRRSIKGVAGYDVTSFIVGSEGTLGLVTEATLHIIPAAPVVETAWLSFADPVTASRASEHIFAAGITPRMLELLDTTAMDVVRPKSAFRLPPAGAAILIECDGRDEGVMRDLERVCEIALARGATESAIAQNDRDREGMRRARRLVSGSLKEAYPYKISDDVAVPRSKMPDLLTRAQELGAPAGIKVAAYGHLGDGNVHINLLCKTADERELAKPVRQEVLRLAVSLGGTVTGEHGIGIAKRSELGFEQSRELIELQKRMKLAFDPGGIINPGKALPV